jgi:hypothetical protein
MKILISEEQLKRIISEQPESRFAPRGMSNKEHMDALNRPTLRPNLDVDDYTDIVSGLIDTIPGIGNGISGAIDITHGITYIVRYYYAKTIEEKVELAVMGLITLGMTFIPVGGNAANILARGEIKTLLKKTPYEIRLMMKNMGLIKSAGFQLSKQVWKYSLLIALVKIFRGQLGNVIGDVSGTLTSISNKSKELNPILQNYISTINELKNIKEV